MGVKRDEAAQPWRYKGQMYLSNAEDRAQMFALKGQAEAQAAFFAELVQSGRADPWVHRFEKAGLGLAPFQCVGMDIKERPGFPGDPVLPGGTCDYCGNAILYVFHVVSKDGKRFKVGSDCICKVGDEGLKRDMDRQPAWKALKREKARAASQLRAARVHAELSALMADEANRAALAAMPHPLGYLDREDGHALTALDWARWMFDHCGAAGRVGFLKALKKHLGPGR